MDRCSTTGKVCYMHDEARRRARAKRRAEKRRIGEYLCRHCRWWHYGTRAAP